MRLRDVKVGMKVTRFGNVYEVEEVDKSRQFKVKFKGEPGHYSHIDLRPCHVAPAKPVPAVGTFRPTTMDEAIELAVKKFGGPACDGKKMFNLANLSNAISDLTGIVGPIDGNLLRVALSAVANVKEDKPGSSHYILESTPVDAIEESPVSAMPFGLSSPIAMQMHREYVDALEAAKHEAYAIYGGKTDAYTAYKIVEIGFRAGQKAGQPDHVAALEARVAAIREKAVANTHAIRAKASAECEALNAAIEILKGVA